MRELVYDIEADGLIPTVSNLWIICTIDVNTKEEKFFSDYDSEADGSIDEGIDFLFGSDTLICHNQLGYDLLAIRKVKGRSPPDKVILIDTLVYSQVLNYKRFGQGHSLAKWGNFFKKPKPEHEDWSKYSQEMRHRCVEDSRINYLAYKHLIKELNTRKTKDLLLLGLTVEQSVSSFAADCEYYGWPMNYKIMLSVKADLSKEMRYIESKIEPLLKLKVKQMDKEPEFKETAWVRNGNYAVRTCSWFDVEPEQGQEGLRPIEGDYCRVEVVQPDIGSMESVKLMLYEHGWKPDEWNWVKDSKGKLIKSSPKLTESSLKPLGEVGSYISKYYTLRARHSILEGWLEVLNQDTKRLHGSLFVIGTPTFRGRHSVITNIPSTDAAYGPEFRSMFSCEEGYSVVGADSSGNQLRGLAHYVDDPALTKEIISGDIHTFNQRILESVVGALGDMGRKIAKTFIYAWLYAGGDGKLGLIVTNKRDAGVGAKLREAFATKVPGIKKLIEKIERQFDLSFKATGKGYIQGLDGRPVFCEGKRLALNYLLQSCEKITCSSAIYWATTKLKEEGIWYQPLIFYHD